MKNFALVAGVVLISLLCFEMGLRLFGFSPRTPHVNSFFVEGTETTWSVPDPELGWINKTGTAHAIGLDPAPMTFWSFARRASRSTSDIPADTSVPVMIVGGSVAQSYGVRDEHSFPYLLAERFPNLWVENFGNGGYGTVQSRLLAERAYDQFYSDGQKPKLLIVTFADSHMLRNVSDQSWVYSISDPIGRYVSPPHYTTTGENLTFHPFHTIDFWPLENILAGVTLLHDIWLRNYLYNTASQSTFVSQRILQEFSSFAENHNMKMAIVVVSDDTDSTKDVLEHQPAPYIDCSAPGRANPTTLLLPGNGHPNPELHSILAACIGDWLETEILPELLSSSNVP